MRIFLVIFALFAFCNANNLKVVAALAPQAYFVKAIGGKYVDVDILIPQTQSPETFEPKPSQIKFIKEANVYIKSGMPYEKRWISKFKSINPSMKVVGIDGVEDPHTWLSFSLVDKLGEDIAKNLSTLDVLNSAFYKKNLVNFKEELKKLKSFMKNILKDQKAFFIYHPALFYIAEEFNLRQISIEEEGKEVKLKTLIANINEAKALGLKTLIYQQETSMKKVQKLSKEYDFTLREINPLSEDWKASMIDIAKAIANQ